MNFCNSAMTAIAFLCFSLPASKAHEPTVIASGHGPRSPRQPQAAIGVGGRVHLVFGVGDAVHYAGTGSGMTFDQPMPGSHGAGQSVMDDLREARDTVSQRRLWEAENRLHQANRLRENLIQRLRTAGISQDQLTQLTISRVLIPALPVRAPIHGLVVNFEKLLGHVVHPDESLFEIYDLSHVWVQGFVSERDLSSIKAGQTVRVRFVADESEVVTGILVRSSRAVSTIDRTMSVWIELRQMPRVPVQHHMLARLTIETGRFDRTGLRQLPAD